VRALFRTGSAASKARLLGPTATITSQLPYQHVVCAPLYDRLSYVQHPASKFPEPMGSVSLTAPLVASGGENPHYTSGLCSSPL
jgi:hypothetical protein